MFILHRKRKTVRRTVRFVFTITERFHFMKKLLLAMLCVFICGGVCFAQAKNPTYKKLVLSTDFYAEGAYYGDFNKDGHLDVVYGPYWYAGPDFKKKYEIYDPVAVDPKGYSDNFGVFTADFNNDGWMDVLVCPHPGTDSYWFENPQGKNEHWKKHPAFKNVGNESQAMIDVNGDGIPDLIYNIDGQLGFGTYDPKKTNSWKFNPVSTKDGKYQRYTHGIGAGDINGDGRVDMIESQGWWEQPENPKEGEAWIWHPFHFANAASHLLVFDVDGDGLNDVVCSWHCHEYGLFWWKQVRDESGKISWEKNVILSDNPDLNSDDLRFSQMHAFDAADINGDGLTDFVTGKRFWAHGPSGDKEPSAPAVLYWFELKRDGKGGASFIPHKIDDDSGVGTQVCATADLNDDGIPDVIVGNKKGCFIFLSEK